MEKKITVFGVIGEGFSIGMKNSLSLLGAVILYALTIWIPYLNVGTTIAMCSIPVELSKGKVISPLFIFDAKYRKYMGEFFLLLGFVSIAVVPLILFGFFPAIVISLAWSLAVFLLLDKGVSPGEALIQSNKLTYGYKWTLFFISLVLGLIATVILLYPIFALVDFTSCCEFDSLESLEGMSMPWWPIIMIIIVSLVFQFVSLGATAVVYRKLTEPAPVKAEPKPAPAPVAAEPVVKEKPAPAPKAEEVKPKESKPAVKKPAAKKTAAKKPTKKAE